MQWRTFNAKTMVRTISKETPRPFEVFEYLTVLYFDDKDSHEVWQLEQPGSYLKRTEAQYDFVYMKDFQSVIELLNKLDKIKNASWIDELQTWFREPESLPFPKDAMIARKLAVMATRSIYSLKKWIYHPNLWELVPLIRQGRERKSPNYQLLLELISHYMWSNPTDED